MKKLLTLLLLLAASIQILQAQIDYTEFNPTGIVMPNQDYSFNINSSDFRINYFQNAFSFSDGNFANATISVNSGSGDVIKYYNENDIISPTNSDWNVDGWEFGTLPSGITYLGFRTIDGNSFKYGWLKIEIIPSTEIRIISYAYQNSVDTPIAAGDTGSGTNIPVTSITVTGQGNVSSITTLGGTLQMNATVAPANATDNSFTWSVNNGTGTASINTNGLLTALSDGNVTVVATANDGSGITSTKVITISNQTDPDIPVTSITLESETGGNTTDIYNDLQMIAMVNPTNATNPNVIWSVINDSGSATIDNAGLLTPNTVGLVSVVATSAENANITASIDINITFATSLNDLDNINFKIYPNPSDNLIRIDTDQKINEINIFNMLGQKVHHNSNSEFINIKHLTNNNYLIVIHFENGAIITKEISKI